MAEILRSCADGEVSWWARIGAGGRMAEVGIGRVDGGADAGAVSGDCVAALADYGEQLQTQGRRGRVGGDAWCWG